MKHSLTSKILITTEEAHELEAKLERLDRRFNLQDEVQLDVAKRYVISTIRLDRMVVQEAMAISLNMRNAKTKYDEDRMAEADVQMKWIPSDPVANRRKLMSNPYGLTRLIDAIDGLRSDLTRAAGYRWEYSHCDQLHNYVGMNREIMPISRIRALSDAIQGKFDHIDPAEIPESEIPHKRRWAIRMMVELIDDELARLRAKLEAFDMTAIELDREEAAGRAMFDASPSGILARKYEAANQRTMFKALHELEALQARTPPEPPRPAQDEPESEPAPEPVEELGSFFPEPPDEPDAETNPDPTPVITSESTPKKRPNLEKLARKGRRSSRSA